jgi:hypothetical protein
VEGQYREWWDKEMPWAPESFKKLNPKCVVQLPTLNCPEGIVISQEELDLQEATSELNKWLANKS